MATILEFPPPQLRAGDRSAMQSPAEVVIFPGVRIERSEFNLAERFVPRRRRPARSPQAETEE